MQSDRERVETICSDWTDHDFVEIYYGHECQNCGLFYAFGCAPWDEDEREIYETAND
jgi:hypothetical protein